MSAAGRVVIVRAREAQRPGRGPDYFGTPTADGARLACNPDVSFDTRGNRLLMIEPAGGNGCEGNSFALDLATATLSRL